MAYLKIQRKKIVEAPETYTVDGRCIQNFNKNVDLMLQCGFEEYPGCIGEYEIVDGEITKKPQPERVIFTKLQIRRACRQIGKQDVLDNVIDSNELFKADWTDAQQINLTDPVFVVAIESSEQGKELLRLLKEHFGVTI